MESYQELFSSLLKSSQVLIDTWFKGTNLRYINFSNANLKGSRFHGCWLNYCNMENTNLEGCDFDNTSVLNCNFTNTNMNQVDLKGVYLFIPYEFERKDFSSFPIFKNTQLNNIKIDDENAEYLRELGVEFTRAEEDDEGKV